MPKTHHPYRERALPPAPPDASAELRRRIELLRGSIAQTEAFAHTADDMLEEVRNDPRHRERVAWQVSGAAESALEALEAVELLLADLPQLIRGS